jgi:hypothetical protein
MLERAPAAAPIILICARRRQCHHTPADAHSGGNARVMDVEAGSLIVIAAQVGTAQDRRIFCGSLRPGVSPTASTDLPVRDRAYGDSLVRMPADRKHSACSAVTGNRASAAAGPACACRGRGRAAGSESGAFGRDQAVPDAVLDPCDSAVATSFQAVASSRAGRHAHGHREARSPDSHCIGRAAVLQHERMRTQCRV